MPLRLWLWWHRRCDVTRVSSPAWDVTGCGYLCRDHGSAR